MSAGLGLEPQAADLLAHPGAFGLGDNLGTFDHGFAGHVVLAVGEEQNAVEFDRGAVFDVQMVNIESLPLGYLVLLATGYNYSVNGTPPDKNNLPLYQSDRGRATPYVSPSVLSLSKDMAFYPYPPPVIHFPA